MSNANIDFGGVLKDVHVPADHALNVDVNSSPSNPVYVSSANGTVVYTIVVDYTSINSNAGSFYQIVASTSQSLRKVIPYDTTGVAIGLYSGGSGSESLILNMGPGYDIPTDLTIAASTRLSIRALGASAPTAGKFYIQLIG